MSILRVMTLTRSYITRFNTDTPRLIALFFWMLLDIILFGCMAKIYIAGESGYFFLLGALVAWGLIVRISVEIPWCLLRDLWTKNFINIFSSPVSVYEWMMSLVCTNLYLYGLLFIFSCGVLKVFFSFNILSLGWSLFPLLCNYFFIAVCIGFINTGILIRYGLSVLSYIFMLSWGLAPLCGVYYDISLLPVWAQVIAKSLPMYHGIAVIKNLILTNVFDWHQFAISVGLTGLYLILSTFFLVSMFNKSKDIGLQRL